MLLRSLVQDEASGRHGASGPAKLSSDEAAPRRLQTDPQGTSRKRLAALGSTDACWRRIASGAVRVLSGVSRIGVLAQLCCPDTQPLPSNGRMDEPIRKPRRLLSTARGGNHQRRLSSHGGRSPSRISLWRVRRQEAAELLASRHRCGRVQRQLRPPGGSWLGWSNWRTLASGQRQSGSGSVFSPAMQHP